MRIRNLPRHAIVTKLKRAGVRQEDIAQRVGVNQGTVSKVLTRTWRGTPTVEAVWREIERALSGAA